MEETYDTLRVLLWSMVWVAGARLYGSRTFGAYFFAIRSFFRISLL